MKNIYKQEEIVTDLLSINQIINCVPKDTFISKPVCDLSKFLDGLDKQSNLIEEKCSRYSFIKNNQL